MKEILDILEIKLEKTETCDCDSCNDRTTKEITTKENKTIKLCDYCLDYFLRDEFFKINPWTYKHLIWELLKKYKFDKNKLKEL